MKVISADFVKSAYSIKDCPRDGLPQVAICGRSNVGKSSLINCLAGRKGLARVSNRPGATRAINFYAINRRFYIVDLPGFGYANCPINVKRQWAKMVEGYIDGAEDLGAAIVLVDARRDIEEEEEMLLKWFEGMEVPVIAVLTKSDKINRSGLMKSLKGLKDRLRVPSVLATSAHTGQGRAELLREIDALLSK
jgi:GTP-binding protein